MRTQRGIRLRRWVTTALTALGLSLCLPAVALAQPANDHYSGAIALTLPSTTTQSTVGATAGSADPTDCFTSGSTVWFSFTPTTSQDVQIDTIGSNYDTTLQVVTGSPGAFTTVACNDDSNVAPQSAVGFAAEKGTTYHIVVGSCCDANQPGGNLTLNVAPEPPAIQSHVTLSPNGTVNTRTGVATIHGTYTCNQPAPAYIDIYGDASQKKGRLIASSYYGLEVPCASTPTRWAADLLPTTVAFAPGSATVDVTSSACNVFSCSDGQSFASAVKLTARG